MTPRLAPMTFASTRSNSCPICMAADATSRAFARDGLAVWACAVCGVEYLNPQPDDASLGRIYSSSYFFGTETDAARERHQKLKTATAKIYLDLLSAQTDARARKMLEIGCGTGDFLLEASARGFDVTGVELSPSSTETASQRLGRGAIIRGTLESAALPPESFDVVANSDVVEHVRDPIAFAREINRVLKPGGVLLMVTPSLDSWSRRLMGTLWMEYKPEHLYYFGRRSLTKLLAESGFVDINIVPNVKVLNVDYTAAHFERFPIRFFSPLVRTARRIVPDSLAFKPFRIVASGMTAFARKSS